MIKKRGQVTIFVIIAIALVAGILIYFVFKGQLFATEVPAEFKPIYNYYAECIAQETQNAIDLAESQGGHIYLPEYDPASEYAPFSSQFNFLGFPVPYWYYVSGNGIIREQVPLKSEIEKEIATYVEERVNNCDFENFYAQGFYIDLGEPRATVKLEDTKVLVTVTSAVASSREEQSALKSEHKIEVNSKLGKFYDLAIEIYDKEKNDAFLENYSTDVLRLYAPVDGVELSCSGKVWRTREVIDDLKSGLEANIGAIKFSGDYYSLGKKENEYFVVDQPVDESVNLLYNKDWPTKIEIAGASDELMIAQPVGNQEGLGVMGFCFAPYHFVYDISFPVLMQIYDGGEIFQFPVIVVIDKNVPRQAVFSEIEAEEDFNLCEFKTQDIEVNSFDVNLKPIDTNISYECFTQQCLLGESKNGMFKGKAPACVNGYLVLRADGYAEKRVQFSSNENTFADAILDREYEVNVDLEIGGKILDGTAIVTFAGDKTYSTALPENNKIKLSEGLYNVTVFAYGNSSIVISGGSKTQCTEVPKTGIFGLFGGTREECYDITIPDTKIDSALIGGGRSEIYILPSDLEKGKVTIIADSFAAPNSLEQLQYNFESFDSAGVDLEF